MKIGHSILALTLSLSTIVAAQEAIQVELRDSEPLPQSLCAFNSNLLMATAIHGITYGGPEFNQAIRDLRPGGLRFPGGTTANNYLWREDSYSRQQNDKTGWAAPQLEVFRKIGRKYDLPGYAETCREFNLTPIYVLNIYEETPDSVVAMFKRFDELGLDVKAIEMGNEPYWDPRSLMNVWDYIKLCRPLAEVIRRQRPGAKIGACFGPIRADSACAEEWNKPLAKQDWYDAVVYHEYYGGQGFAFEEGTDLTLESVLHPEAFIDEPVDYFNELLPGKPIWFTEWNIGANGLDRWKNTGAELLFIAAAVTRILDHHEAFDWSCFHQIYEGKFGTFAYDEAKGIQTFPSYELFRMIGAACSGASSFRSLALNEVDNLRGFLTESESGRRLFLLNRGSLEQRVAIPEGMTGNVAGLTIATEPESSLPVSSTIARRLNVAQGSVILPPYSITLIASSPVVRSAMHVEVKKSENLFPTRPHLTLWYEPYAAKQPRVAPDGSYTLNLTKLANKKTAVVKLNLSGMTPTPGARLTLTFEGSASKAAGFIVQLPDAAKRDGRWTQLTREKSTHVLQFSYDPAVNEGEVTFVLPEKTLAEGGELRFGEFRLVELREAKSPN